MATGRNGFVFLQYQFGDKPAVTTCGEAIGEWFAVRDISRFSEEMTLKTRKSVVHIDGKEPAVDCADTVDEILDAIGEANLSRPPT